MLQGERLPICGDKEGDTRAESVPFLGELVQEDDEEGCRDELDDEETDTCAEVGGLTIEACEGVGDCLGKGVGDCEGSRGLAVEACEGVDDCLGEGVGDCEGSRGLAIEACKDVDDCLGEGVGDCEGSKDQLIAAGQRGR